MWVQLQCVADAATEDIWNNIKTGLLKTTDEVCGTTWRHRWCHETWWWNELMEKAWKTGQGTRASYNAAKHIARYACQEAYKKVCKNIGPESSEVYHLPNQLRRENADVVGDKPADVVGDKPVKNDAG